MYPVDNNYIDSHKSVFLNLLLILLATGLGMIGFHMTFLQCIDTCSHHTGTAQNVHLHIYVRAVFENLPSVLQFLWITPSGIGLKLIKTALE